MAGVHDHRQVGELFEHGHGGEVEGVARGRLEGADAALAKDHLFVAPGHDVLGAHEQLLQGVGQPALDEDGLSRVAQLLEQLEVLHVARADLDHVHLVKERKLA